jgi:sec-independent protein translocase protein TatC
MTFLEHLDELRSRLLRSVLALVAAFLLCWGLSGRILAFLLEPVRRDLFQGGDIVFIHLTEPFVVHMKAAALAGVFLAAPYILHELWAFVAPGLYPNERKLGLAFLVSGTILFTTGGAFAYAVAVPVAARWLLSMGADFKAQLTLGSVFHFECVVLLGMGIVFELPMAILLLSRIGVVSPRFLMRHFRVAVLLIAVAAAVMTPTGDVITMTVFGAPMVALYLLGVGISWLFGRSEPVLEAEKRA